MLHKSANVLVACQDQVATGMPTWSLSTGYQAAFFALDAILKILGVAVVEIDNVSYTVDLWPEPDDSLKGKARSQYQLGSEVQIIRHDRLQHFHRWGILQRVLRTTANHRFDVELVAAVLRIGDRDFARQRNDLQYDPVWKFGDLHGYNHHPGFFELSDKNSVLARLDCHGDDFGVILATVLFSFSVVLLRDLATLSTVIDQERLLLSAACSDPRMKLRPVFEASGAGVLA